MDEVTKRWNSKAQKLVGCKIVAASYMSKDEAEAIGWSRRPLVIQLDNDALLMAASDDEGNEAGAIFVDFKGGGLPSCFPVIR